LPNLGDRLTPFLKIFGIGPLVDGGRRRRVTFRPSEGGKRRWGTGARPSRSCWCCCPRRRWPSPRRWVRRTDALPDLPGWALADRSWGAVVTWFLLGGSIFTAYTFAAVPGVAFAAGEIGFFPFVLIAIVFVAADAIALRALNQSNPEAPVIFSDPDPSASRTPVVRIGQP
jgi:hypothetical protein